MIISLDTEYSSLDVTIAQLLSISIGTTTSELLFRPDQINEVKKITDEAECIFVQNGQVDYLILKRHGLELDRSRFIDTMLCEHLIDERLDHDLGSMAIRYFNDPYKSVFWSKYDLFSSAPKDEADEYERKDVRYTFDLGIKFLEQLKSNMKLVEHVHKLHWCLADIEEQGIRIDTELLNKTNIHMTNEIQGMLPKLREEFRDYCETWEMQKWAEEIEKRSTERGKSGVVKPVFSFTSDRQVSELLYGQDFLGIKPTSKTKKGNPSTSYDTLQEVSKDYPKVQSIVDFKGAKAVYSTFVKGLSERIRDGKVHPHHSVNGTETGRLSSSNPNFQNMPQEGVIRNFVLPDDGCLIIGSDYSSLEVFVEANMTEDPRLLQIALEGADKHSMTAEAVGMSRKDAKTLNFLCQYGGGVWKIQDTFKISEKEAQIIYDKYWSAYSGVMNYKKRVFKELADTNQVINCFGRVRHFDSPKNRWEREKNERKAYSHMIQGPGAEMTNYATYTASEYLKKNTLGRVMIPIHDELVCSIDKNRVEEGTKGLIRIMESANDFLKFKYRVKVVPYGPFEFWKKA